MAPCCNRQPPWGRACHLKFFSKRKLLKPAAEEGVHAIESALFRSVHFLFTSRRIPIEPSKVHPKLVVRLAEAFLRFESAEPCELGRPGGLTLRNILFPPKQ